MSKKFRPESQMMSHGFDPKLSEGAVKAPVFQTSTFVFDNAEEGKAFFELAYGLRDKEEKEEMGLIYSRLNNPNLEILENRLCLWDKADDAAVFSSGMAAISTALLTFCLPGDLLVYSNPVYGGTDHFINHVLTSRGIHVIGIAPSNSFEEILKKIDAHPAARNLKMIHLETPANPTNELIDLAKIKRVADHFSTPDKKVIFSVDNTYLGPIFQHPLKFGADLVLYSATKYIGGHSDLIAGVCLGSVELMAQVKGMRTFIGNMADPHTAWLLMRSLETLQIRFERQSKNAMQVAKALTNNPMIEEVNFLGLLNESESPEQYAIFKTQCEGPGAMISLYLKGGEKEAFQMLNSMKLIKLAVSLGSTESLAQHPATMTHADVDPAKKTQMRISSNLVRISIGVEHPEDLIWDITQALEAIKPEPEPEMTFFG